MWSPSFCLLSGRKGSLCRSCRLDLSLWGSRGTFCSREPIWHDPGTFRASQSSRASGLSSMAGGILVHRRPWGGNPRRCWFRPSHSQGSRNPAPRSGSSRATTLSPTCSCPPSKAPWKGSPLRSQAVYLRIEPSCSDTHSVRTGMTPELFIWKREFWSSGVSSNHSFHNWYKDFIFEWLNKIKLT